MPIIYLVRHGENDYVKEGRLAGRLQGIHLNERGYLQATHIADNVKNLPIKAIYSSPLDRTMETAAPIASLLNLEVQQREDLAEVNFGTWEGKTLKSLRRRKLWNTVQRSPSMMRFPQGESFLEAQQRVVNFLNCLSAEAKPKDLLLCVTHSDIIKLAVSYYLGLHLDFFQRIIVSPGSITTLGISQIGGVLLMLNYEPSNQNNFP